MQLSWQWLDAGAVNSDASILVVDLPRRPKRSEQIAVSEELTQRLFRSRDVQIDKADLGRTIYGRPQLRCRRGAGFSYSIAHTDHITVGVIRSNIVGIDIEALHRRLHVKPARLIQRMFRTEQEASICLQNHRLIEAWTAKEAVLKASGYGLTIGMQNVRLTSDYGGAYLLGQSYTLRRFIYRQFIIVVAMQSDSTHD